MSQNEGDQLLNTVVFPIVIPTPFAVGDVHSYLIKDEKTVLVDCGPYADEAYDRIIAGLREQRLTVDDVDEIWLTHGHPDHYGQAARLANESGAVVKGHAKERTNFAANSDTDMFKSFFEKHAIKPPVIGEMLHQLDWLQQYQQPVEPEWINEGEVLETGRLAFSVQHTPGHAPGHVVFYADEGLYFGGDVLLEHISTNALINFDAETGARNKSLLQYRHSLRWMQQQEGLVLPGHGKQITNIAEIASHHLREQQQRYQQILHILENEGPQTLPQLSQRLFADALKEGAHFLVYSEIIGYLDWGEQEGQTLKEETSRGMIYNVIEHG